MKGSVRQLRDGGWLADVTIGGTRRTARASTKNEALAHRRAINEELSRAAAVPLGRRSFTFQEALDLSATIRWSGAKSERTSLINARAVVEHFGAHTQLASVTAGAADQWRQSMLRAGKRPATVNRKLSALRGMLSDAVLHGHIEAAPQLPRQLTPNTPRDRVVEDWERDLLLQWFTQAGEPTAGDLMVFLLETAVRWGEAERLKGADVDLARGRVTLWETKTGKPRTIPLTRRAQDAIRPHLPVVRSHRVWPYPYHAFRRLLQRALEGCGLGEEGIGIHTMRHTCASKLASAGVSVAQLQKFGGWSSLTACQRYVHLDAEALHGCIAALERCT